MADYAGKTVVFKTEAELNEAIRLYEEETVTHFVTSTVMKSFTKTEMKVNRFRWYVNGRSGDSVTIPYDGIPFCFVGKKMMSCHLGEDRGRATKKKYHEEKAKAMAAGLKKFRKRAPVPTKKSQCTAKISIKKIVKFPEYQLMEGKEANYDQRQNNKRLLAALNRDSEAVLKQIQYFVKFPAIDDHKDHPMGEEAAKKEPIDKRVYDKMKQLADTGVASYTALQKLVYSYVENELFKDKPPPPRTRRRYYPSVKDVQNFMTKHKSAGIPRESSNDNLVLSVPDWQFNVAEQAEDGNGDGNQEQIVTFQTQYVSTKEEQESFLTLLNAGMTETIQQEVVATTSTIAPPHSIAPTPQIMHCTTEPEHLNSTDVVRTVEPEVITRNSTPPQIVAPTPQIVTPTPQIVASTPQIVTSTPQIMHTTPSSETIKDAMESQMASTSMMPDNAQVMAVHTDPSSGVMLASELMSVSVNSTDGVSQDKIQDLIAPAESMPSIESVQSIKPERKPQRIGLVCRMKTLSRELLDYSLLVKDLNLLEGFVDELESMVTKASSSATLDPLSVQKELARNRKKRQAGPPVFLNDPSKKLRLSDILLSQPERARIDNDL